MAASQMTITATPAEVMDVLAVQWAEPQTCRGGFAWRIASSSN